MKIALAYDKETNGFSPSFIRTGHFKFYEIENRQIGSSEMIGTMKCDPEQLVGMLLMFETDVLLCRRLDEASAQLLQEEGIDYYTGLTGEADLAVEQYLSGNI